VAAAFGTCAPARPQYTGARHCAGERIFMCGARSLKVRGAGVRSALGTYSRSPCLTARSCPLHAVCVQDPNERAGRGELYWTKAACQVCLAKNNAKQAFAKQTNKQTARGRS